MIGSLTTFKGEPRLEGPALCFTIRGEPDELLGERGGAVPAGNIEGKELLAAFGLEQLPGTFKGAPDLASLSNDVTYTVNKGDIKIGSQMHVIFCRVFNENNLNIQKNAQTVCRCKPAFHTFQV